MCRPHVWWPAQLPCPRLVSCCPRLGHMLVITPLLCCTGRHHSHLHCTAISPFSAITESCCPPLIGPTMHSTKHLGRPTSNAAHHRADTHCTRHFSFTPLVVRCCRRCYSSVNSTEFFSRQLFSFNHVHLCQYSSLHHSPHTALLTSYHHQLTLSPLPSSFHLPVGVTQSGSTAAASQGADSTGKQAGNALSEHGGVDQDSSTSAPKNQPGPDNQTGTATAPSKGTYAMSDPTASK